MPDITMCSPTEYLPKCDKCYRRRARPSQWQSYCNFYDDCKDGKYEQFMEWKGE